MFEPPAAKANEISAARLPGPLGLSLVTKKPGAAAGGTVIGLLVPEIVADESLAVMVCVPLVLSVAVSVAMPPENDTAAEAAAEIVGECHRVAEAGDDVVVLIFSRDRDAARAAGRETTRRSR